MGHETLRQAIGPDALPWLLGLLLLVLGAATLEGLVQTFVLRRRYDWRAYAASLADAVGRRAVDALGLSIAAPLLAWAYAHRVQTIALDVPAAFALLFVGQELCYYGYHRAAHRVRWFWATHAVHHSPNELTLAAALRLGWTGKLSGAFLFYTPLIWLGFKPHNRGVVMNPVDHPLGGGEGRSSGGRHPVSPWGQPAKGYKTRSNKRTDALIIRRRNKGK